MEIKLSVRGEYDWDSALTESEDNPFPLAPKNWVRRGQVTRGSYKIQNELLGDFVRDIMVAELPRMAGKHIEVFGAGLTRDLDWMIDAVMLSRNTVAITDSSRIACMNAARFLKRHGLRDKVQVRETEVSAGWQMGTVKYGKDAVVYAGQFFQNQDEAMLERMMRFLGITRTTIYMLHARGEDNPPDQVEWSNTVPYRDEEWQTPYQAGLGRNANIAVLGGPHRYFSQKYTLFRISPS